jgi:hypothetical protein
MLVGLQFKAITEGLDMDERVQAAKYEKELGEWLDASIDDVRTWLKSREGALEYAEAENLRSTAKALRKGEYFGTPIV